MPYQNFELTITENIAELHFNRPEKANALNRQSWEELKAAFEELDKDPSVRVVILSGKGKHFCSGIDLELLMYIQQLNQNDCEGRKREKLKDFIVWLQDSINAIEKCRKPVIAAIHGACLGGGLDIAAACDMRFCTEDARFSIKETELGLVADLGVLQRLPRIIPHGWVAEMAYTSRMINAQEARAIGLINEVTKDKVKLDSKVRALALSVAEKSPLVIRGLKQNLLFSRDHNVSEGLEYVANWNAAMLISRDILEAFQANLEKRTPRFEE